MPVTTCSAKAGVTRMPTPISATRHGMPRSFRLCAIVLSSTVIASWIQIRSRFMRRASGTSLGANARAIRTCGISRR